MAAAGGACSLRAGSWRVGGAGLQVTRCVGGFGWGTVASCEALPSEAAAAAPLPTTSIARLQPPSTPPLPYLPPPPLRRSVGDADLKAQGVSAEAEASELALQPGDAFVIVATDGLWDRVRWGGRNQQREAGAAAPLRWPRWLARGAAGPEGAAGTCTLQRAEAASQGRPWP